MVRRRVKRRVTIRIRFRIRCWVVPEPVAYS